VKFVIDLIPAKHNMLKELYQSKKIVSGLGMNYVKIDACKNIFVWWKVLAQRQLTLSSTRRREK
jgi:hypothetical protein